MRSPRFNSMLSFVIPVFALVLIAGCGPEEAPAPAQSNGGYDMAGFAESEAGKKMLAAAEAQYGAADEASDGEAAADESEVETDDVAPASREVAEEESSLFPHSKFDGILGTYVDERGMVDYAALKAARGPLDDYVNNLGAVSLDVYREWPEEEQIAFWLNAYNAITLRYILDAYPIEKGGLIAGLRFPKNSIRQIDGVWDRKVTKVISEMMTLDAIEHEVLRKKFDEPRLHMALVCASVGCPPLRQEAYTGARLEEQLDDQSRRFLTDPEKFRVDMDGKTVYYSPIFSWYGKDFVGSYGDPAIDGHSTVENAWLSFAARYLPEEAAAFLRDGTYSLSELDYDWSLNESGK